MKSKKRQSRQLDDTFLDKCFPVGFYLLVIGLPLVFSQAVYWYYDVPKLALLQVVTLFLGTVWFLKNINSPEFKLRRSPLDYPILIFLLIAAASTATSVHPPTSLFGSYARFEGLITLISYSVIYFLAVQCFSDKKIDALLTVMLSTAGALSLIEIIRWLVSGRPAGGFIFITLGNVTYGAAYLLLIIPLAVVQLFDAKTNTRRIFYGLISLITILCLFITFRRASGIALSFSLIFLGWLLWGQFREKKLKWLFAISLFILIAGLTALMIFRGSLSVNKFENLTKTLQLSGSEATRLEMWKGALQVIAERPLLGSGPDTFAFAFQKHASERLVQLEGPKEGVDVLVKDPHNHFLNIAATMGLPALLIYLSIFIIIVTIAIKAIRTTRHPLLSGLLAGIFGYLIALQFIPSNVSTTPLFWLLIGLLISQIPLSVKMQIFPLKINSRAFSALTIVVVLVLLFLGSRSLLADYYFMRSYSGDANQDLKECQKGIGLAPLNDFYSFHLAEIYLRLYSLQPQEDLYRLALDNAITAQNKNPVNPYNAYFQGKIFTFKKGDDLALNQAIDQFKRAVALFPNYPQAHLELGKAYFEMESFSEARNELERAVKLNPKYEEARAILETLKGSDR